MSSKSPVALILGAGSNVGRAVNLAFQAKGYKTALVSRSLKEEESTETQLHIRGDFNDPDSIPNIFSRVRSSLGDPHVVIYNAAAVKFQDAKDPLAIDLASFQHNLNINTMSAFVAAQEAVRSFGRLPDTASRTFIFTGNILNVSPIVAFMDAGAGKSATAHIVQCAASAYKDRGFKFYYADERNADGSPVYNDIDGPAHGKHYAQLAEEEVQGPWRQTFVKDVGYREF